MLHVPQIRTVCCDQSRRLRINENERSIETAKATAAWFNVLFNDMPERLQDGHNPLGDDVLVVGVVVRVVEDLLPSPQ